MIQVHSDVPVAPGALTLADQELFDRLGWFTQIRWLFGLFCLMVLLVSWHLLGLRLRTVRGTYTMAPAVNAVLILFLFNAAFMFVARIVQVRRRVSRRLIESIALAQTVCDLVAITALIHYTGGVENAFVILILVPTVIVSELLPPRWTYASALVAAAMLNAMAWGEQQGFLPHIQAGLAARGSTRLGFGLYADPFYVLHVTSALTATLFAMVFVTTTIAARLQERETQLATAHERLRRSDEAKGFFMRRAEHEMRAPLAAIHSILETIEVTLARGAPVEESQRLIQRGKTRTKDLIELVKDLRRYSRLQSPDANLAMERVCLSDVVLATVELFSKQAEAASLQLNWHADPARVWVQGNPEMLRELVTNLVANAVQYTPGQGRIDVALTARDSQATLTVVDTGIGIKADFLRRVFEEFYRSPEAKKFFGDGTGLGLAIVKRIVEVHDGRIDVDSREGEGTSFTVHLPASPPPGTGPPTGAPA